YLIQIDNLINPPHPHHQYRNTIKILCLLGFLHGVGAGFRDCWFLANMVGEPAPTTSENLKPGFWVPTNQP
ncbi:MAG: hypothetical protein EAZ68_12795, partial [Oscillatoriales cyanobacterium]